MIWSKKLLMLALSGGTLQIGVATEALAGFAPQFLGTSADGANTAFNYNLLFTTTPNEESLIAGGGAIDPGVMGSSDFLTFVDFSGLVSATAGPNFVASTQNTGSTGPLQAPTDSPSLANVTFRYTGPALTVDTLLPGFSLVSTLTATGLGLYTSQRTDALGFDVGTKIGESGVFVAPVPEPGTFALLAAGLGVMGAIVFRRRKLS